MHYGMQGYGGYGRAPMGEYFLTGAHGFGAIPQDSTTQYANGLLEELVGGGDGSQSIGQLTDAATKGAVCQRAMDILKLRVCTDADSQAQMQGQNPDCVSPMWTSAGLTVAQMQQKVIAACKTQGITVSAGMSTTTMLLIGAGVLVGGLVLYKVMKK